MYPLRLLSRTLQASFFAATTELRPLAALTGLCAGARPFNPRERRTTVFLLCRPAVPLPAIS